MSGPFFFNFSVETRDKESVEENAPVQFLDSVLKTKECEEVKLQVWHTDFLKTLVSSNCVRTLSISKINLKYIDSTSLPSSLSFDQESEAGLASLLELCNTSHSDLIPGTYEGGLKLWECAFDLVAFLSELYVDFKGKSVLDLGCGVGLPGIYSAVAGADAVHLQDYNSEVLSYVTIPSLLLNLERKSIAEKCRFYSGDWSNLDTICSSQYYDIILTSETIYSLTSVPLLLSALKKHSEPNHGVVYVAAKVVYFGVGGSVAGFREMVEEDKTFVVEEVWRSDRGVSRVILKLSHKTE